ncbi:MAG TPA: TOPRIM nucleotidyl transferase/hydrolase domain-containing protein [Candidatus Dormibacteraeota bacterium]|nr:TOPRIM nucleotidyl transferase/hydrolase domain-containing protein [Candidatus Dormibacteraeota bacterium]
MHTIVIVEGETDKLALTTAARRLGQDIGAEEVDITPIGGAHAISRVLAALAREPSQVRIAGLCDEGEEDVFRVALEAAGYGSHLSRADLEGLGFFVCSADLEDELIRAVGAPAIDALAELEGDAQAWYTFRRQPAWQGQAVDQQFRRFVRSISNRNSRYIRAILEALEPAQLPRPLRLLLAHVVQP